SRHASGFYGEQPFPGLHWMAAGGLAGSGTSAAPASGQALVTRWAVAGGCFMVARRAAGADDGPVGDRAGQLSAPPASARKRSAESASSTRRTLASLSATGSASWNSGREARPQHRYSRAKVIDMIFLIEGRPPAD